jgi:hypothetical protein
VTRYYVVFLVMPLGAKGAPLGRCFASDQDYESLRGLVKSATSKDMGPEDKLKFVGKDTSPVYYNSGFCTVGSTKAGNSIGVTVHFDNKRNQEKYKNNDMLRFIYTQDVEGDFFALCTAAEFGEAGTNLFLHFFPGSVGSLQKSDGDRVLIVHPGSDHDRNGLKARLQKLLDSVHSYRQISMQ